jgi:hypothetical protein
MTPLQELEALKAARFAILTGKGEQKIRYGEREVTYREVDLALLNARIAELEAELAGEEFSRRPIGVVW